MTNIEFSEIFNNHNTSTVSQRTTSARQGIIKNRLLPRYGSKEIRDTSYIDINSIYDEIEEEGLSQNTLFGCYAALSCYFSLAVELNEAEENPVSLARPVRPEL